MKINILHTIETAGPGGAETVVLELASSLDPNKFRSIVVLNNEDWLDKRLRERGVETYILKSGRGWQMSAPRALARIVREQKVDLIHSHLPDQNFYSCIATRLTGCPSIVTYHGPVELKSAENWKDRLKLSVVRNTATKIVVVCDFVGEMLKRLRMPSGKIARIYNGTRTERMDAVPNGSLRRELGIGENVRLIGTVANVRESKGYEYFVRAASAISRSHKDVMFIAVGDKENELAQPILELAKTLRVDDRIHFLGFREDVPAILKDLDIFVLASTSEGFPLAVLEAMAAAKPIVVTDCGGPPELVTAGITGIIVPIRDTDALQSGIAELLTHSDRARSLGAAGKLKVQAQFSLSSMVQSYERLYQEVLG